MKSILTTIALLALLASSPAQERLSRAECLKHAFWLTLDLKQMLNTPIPTDPDVKRPVALRDGEYGGMVLPETKLDATAVAKAAKQVVPVGQLWLVKVVPMKDGQAIRASKLRLVDVKTEHAEATASCFALGVRKSDADSLELLIYGKDPEPLLRVPLKSVSSEQEGPIDMSAERKDEGAEIKLKLVGKYEATFMVTALEQ